MRLRSRLPARGFSLVEVALSLAILSVAMVGVLSLLPVGLDAARQVHAEAVAAQVVRGAIDSFATNGKGSNSFTTILQGSPGNVLTTEYYGRDGETNVPAGRRYFRLDYVRGESGAGAASCRYFLKLTWPVPPTNQATSSRLMQERTFVTDVIRSP